MPRHARAGPTAVARITCRRWRGSLRRISVSSWAERRDDVVTLPPNFTKPTEARHFRSIPFTVRAFTCEFCEISPAEQETSGVTRHSPLLSLLRHPQRIEADRAVLRPESKTGVIAMERSCSVAVLLSPDDRSGDCSRRMTNQAPGEGVRVEILLLGVSACAPVCMRH